jgi:hypothetical protein
MRASFSTVETREPAPRRNNAAVSCEKPRGSLNAVHTGMLQPPAHDVPAACNTPTPEGNFMAPQHAGGFPNGTNACLALCDSTGDAPMQFRPTASKARYLENAQLRRDA